MSQNLPKGILSHRRSGFAIINPETELYHRKRGRGHVAISYVWSEWQDESNPGVPDWPLLRSRLLELVGKNASKFMQRNAGGRVGCWLDSKCIDQSSSDDKAYWIPRMAKIYSKAKCTVLLLRNIDLTPLVHAWKNMWCDIHNYDHQCDSAQNCMLAQSEYFTEEKSLEVMYVLEELFGGTWRRRVWIFQEILLSDTYILSGDNNRQITLPRCGVVASFMFRKYPDKAWLGDFAMWCQRVRYQNSCYQFHELCAANILQMAQHLEATIPADRFYALSGVLGLNKIEYNTTHTADEALKAVISAWAKNGKFSWLYAIPGSITLNQHESLQFSNTQITKYFNLRTETGWVCFQSWLPRVSPISIRIPVHVLGYIESSITLSELLASALGNGLQGKLGNLAELCYLTALPHILHKLAYEIMRKLLQRKAGVRLRLDLGLSKDTSPADVVWHLYTLKDSVAEVPESPASTSSTSNLIASASSTLKWHIEKLQDDFKVVLWQRYDSQSKHSSQSRNMPQDGKEWNVSIGDLNVKPGAKICRVCGKNIMFAAKLGGEVKGLTMAVWNGTILPVHDSDMSQGLMPSISRLGALMTGRATDHRQLKFKLSSGNSKIL